MVAMAVANRHQIEIGVTADATRRDRPTVTISPLVVGVRPWDHVIPLALGDVQVPDAPLELRRVDATPDLVGNRVEDADLDGAETSFSRYVRARASGDDRLIALPVMLMRGFRHRCIIVRNDSDLHGPRDLRGKRIGVTGWPDSGNVWTRAILRTAGVGIADCEWEAGPLTSAHPVTDRIGGQAPPNVSVTPGNRPMVDLLRERHLDAVMTPFMPPGFYEPDSTLRPLFHDVRGAELDYVHRTGYVPGMHVLAFRASAGLDAGAAQALVDAFERSKALAWSRRAKLADITPWQNEEIAATVREFGDDWMPYGDAADERMVADFQAELVAQGLLEKPVPLADLFPFPIEPARSPDAR